MKAWMYALCAAAVWGIAPLVEKFALSGTVRPVTGIVLHCVGVVAAMALCWRWVDWREVSSVGWTAAACFLLSGVAVVAGQLMFFWALKFGEASRVTAISAIYPLITFVLALLFVQESFSMVRLFGVFCIVLGVVLLR